MKLGDEGAAEAAVRRYAALNVAGSAHDSSPPRQCSAVEGGYQRLPSTLADERPVAVSNSEPIYLVDMFPFNGDRIVELRLQVQSCCVDVILSPQSAFLPDVQRRIVNSLSLLFVCLFYCFTAHAISA